MSDDAKPAATAESDDAPQAIVEPIKRTLWVWLVPIAALIFAAGLTATYVIKRGPVITVVLPHGHGIKPEAPLRCRGIDVGQVEHLKLTADKQEVELQVRLDPTARDIARAGARFWVVRPRVSLSGVAGLETIAGPIYLEVSPGTGERQDHFVALADPPLIDQVDADGLEIMLIGERQGNLRIGTPIRYRQVIIGTIVSVGLSSDATAVEARAHIQSRYAALMRTNSRFYMVPAAAIDLGLKGLNVQVESLQSLLDGGIGVATPDQPGATVSTGHRFDLHTSADEKWLAWRPSLPVGTQLLPPGAARPNMQRITVSVTSGRLWTRTRQRKGWALPADAGLLIPADFLANSDKDAQLEVAGRTFKISDLVDGQSAAADQPLATIDVRVAGGSDSAGRIVTRDLSEAEDCLIVTDAASSPIPLAASRLRAEDGRWRVDPAVSFDPGLHGAAVLARADGALVGILLVREGQGVIAPLPKSPV